MTEDNEKKEKIISIRGIDKDLYKRLKAFADEAGKTVGEAVNDAIQIFLSLSGKLSATVDEIVKEAASLRGFNELSITGEEVKGFDKNIIIVDIDKLHLKDFDDEALQKIVRLINIKKLIVSGKVNKVALYSKCFNVSSVEFRED
ncbi:hypothetical protein DRN84_01575 [Candidatus Geothermarchaeota archaeon]|nr:MAG: hypothetical protein DRN87_02130 [Candidatus Geothermarchaeota archaeon]RLG62571.1 MAG: hypothetical protein DRN84_01575 [Candidatus Geothermarchaeota archaeon]HEW94337.1 hypothetical protein [Thermoprotei archaeon]